MISELQTRLKRFFSTDPRGTRTLKIFVLILLIGAITGMAHLGGPLAMNFKTMRASKAPNRWNSAPVLRAARQLAFNKKSSRRTEI